MAAASTHNSHVPCYGHAWRGRWEEKKINGPVEKMPPAPLSPWNASELLLNWVRVQESTNVSRSFFLLLHARNRPHHGLSILIAPPPLLPYFIFVYGFFRPTDRLLLFWCDGRINSKYAWRVCVFAQCTAFGHLRAHHRRIYSISTYSARNGKSFVVRLSVPSSILEPVYSLMAAYGAATSHEEPRDNDVRFSHAEKNRFLFHISHFKLICQWNPDECTAQFYCGYAQESVRTTHCGYDDTVEARQHSVFRVVSCSSIRVMRSCCKCFDTRSTTISFIYFDSHLAWLTFLLLLERGIRHYTRTHAAEHMNIPTRSDRHRQQQSRVLRTKNTNLTRSWKLYPKRFVFERQHRENESNKTACRIVLAYSGWTDEIVHSESWAVAHLRLTLGDLDACPRRLP